MSAAGTKARGGLDLAVFYFCAHGASGVLLPFLPLILKDRGFHGQAIAAVMMVVPIGNLVVPPLWGLLADKLDARLLCLRIATLGGALGTLLIYPAQTLATAIGAMSVYCFFRTPVLPLVDAATVAMLGDDRGRYPRIRVWGSIGFTLFAVLTGALGGSGEAGALLLASAGLQLLSVIATARFVPGSRQLRPSVFADLLKFLRTPPLPLLLLASAVYYAAHSSYDIYYGLHLRSLGHGDAFVGVALGIGVLVEVGLLFAIPTLWGRFETRWFLVAAGLASVLRWALLATVHQTWALLLLQPLHGLTFGVWFVALVKWVQDLTPDHLRTSVQSAIMASIAMGTVLGYALGGALFDTGGGPAVFSVAAGLAGLATLLYAGAGVHGLRVNTASMEA